MGSQQKRLQHHPYVFIYMVTLRFQTPHRMRNISGEHIIWAERSREEELLCKRCADSKRWATLQNWARWGGTAAHQLGIRKQSCCIEKKQSRNELERNGERWKTCFPPLRPDGWGLQLSAFRLHESSAGTAWWAVINEVLQWNALAKPHGTHLHVTCQKQPCLPRTALLFTFPSAAKWIFKWIAFKETALTKAQLMSDCCLGTGNHRRMKLYVFRAHLLLEQATNPS